MAPPLPPASELPPPLPPASELPPPLPPASELEAPDANAEAGSSAGAAPRNGDWTAIWSAPANAYYFWNATTNTTTWENPIPTGETSTSSSTPTPGPDERLDGIDPDLVYLDPSLSATMTPAGPSTAPAFSARFNLRTGRFQGDPTMTPDRVSAFNRGNRQQEAYYDTGSWAESLAGKGVKASRGALDEKGHLKRKPTTKMVEQFKLNKADKRSRKIKAWLAD